MTRQQRTAHCSLVGCVTTTVIVRRVLCAVSPQQLTVRQMLCVLSVVAQHNEEGHCDSCMLMRYALMTMTAGLYSAAHSGSCRLSQHARAAPVPGSDTKCAGPEGIALQQAALPDQASNVLFVFSNSSVTVQLLTFRHVSIGCTVTAVLIFWVRTLFPAYALFILQRRLPACSRCRRAVLDMCSYCLLPLVEDLDLQLSIEYESCRLPTRLVSCITHGKTATFLNHEGV